jgi:hypothetical protein
MENTRNIKVTDCQFTDVGGNAIMLSGYNKNNTISGNHISGAGASGIAFVGETDAVRSLLSGMKIMYPMDNWIKHPVLTPIIIHNNVLQKTISSMI